MVARVTLTSTRRSSPLVSIVIPVYNTETEFLGPCFDSLNEVNDHRLEIVVVDDGSTSLGVDLEATAEQMKHPTIVVRQENLGQNAARRAGVEVASGEFILFVDSDDRVSPEGLREALDLLDHSSYDILFFNFVTVNVRGVLVERPHRFTETSSELGVREAILCCGALWRQFIHRSLLIGSAETLLDSVRVAEDVASLVPIVSRAKSIGATNVVVYEYVQRLTSIIGSSLPGQFCDAMVAFEWMLPRLSTASLFRDEVEWLAILHVVYWNGLRAVASREQLGEARAVTFEWMSKFFPTWRVNRYLRKSQLLGSLEFRLIIAGHWRRYAFARRFHDRIKVLSPSLARAGVEK